jgi:hypothetical protein
MAAKSAPSPAPVELGPDTFGDVEVDAASARVPYPQVIRNVVEQAVLADQVGVDFFGIGEHHRDDFAISSPEIVAGPTRVGTTCSRSPSGSTRPVIRCTSSRRSG